MKKKDLQKCGIAKCKNRAEFIKSVDGGGLFLCKNHAGLIGEKKLKIAETTYNKYKRQRKELMNVISVDVQEFILDRKDWKKRLNYLKQCMETYRVKSLWEERDE